LKETLQFYALDFICNSVYGQDLIFTGGSALRIFYGLNRLSEDLDFNLGRGKKIDKEQLVEDILTYFKKRLSFPKIEATISGKEKKIYLKFPILYDLGLAGKSESEKLYVKLEIAENISRYYQTEFLPVSKFNLNFVVRVYTLETMMASKIITILNRTFRKGEGNKITFKGRDYYDLLWFLQKGINPDIKRLGEVLGISRKKDIYKQLSRKIKKINPDYLKEDILPLFEDRRFIEKYCQNYKEMIKKYIS
jgi:predicted nucleotidyltransferase component of viral defense system